MEKAERVGKAEQAGEAKRTGEAEPSNKAERAGKAEPSGKGAKPEVRAGRVYDPPGPRDGVRVLIDRLWPRGVRKEGAPWDEWCKEAAPTSELRTWYHKQPERYEEFCARYAQELDDEAHAAAVAQLIGLAEEHGTLTLLTAVKEVGESHVPVLERYLKEHIGG